MFNKRNMEVQQGTALAEFYSSSPNKGYLDSALPISIFIKYSPFSYDPWDQYNQVYKIITIYDAVKHI